MKAVRVTGVALAALLGLAACGGDSEQQEVTEAPQEDVEQSQMPVELGEGEDSGVQDVPIPDPAEEAHSSETLKGWEVPGSDYAGVVGWYEDRLPVGEAHNGMEYCETQEFDDSVVWLWWEEAEEGHDGTPWLSVSVSDADPVGVSVSYVEDDFSDCY